MGQHLYHTPRFKLKVGYTGFTLPVRPSVHLSICGQNRLRFVSSTILTGSIHIHSSYQATSEGGGRVCDVVCNFNFFFKIKKIWTFGKFFKFVSLTLSCFDLGSNMKVLLETVILANFL